MSGFVLTLNAGSSSLKFGLFEAVGDPVCVAHGMVDRIGASASLRAVVRNGSPTEVRAPAEDHSAALEAILSLVDAEFPGVAIRAVGHRVVHGGTRFAEPAVLTDHVIAELEALIPFAPLHQPHNLAGVGAARRAFPDALQVACFDTAFHRNHPWVNDVFALPAEYYARGVRRYGFHGLSYDYISGELRRIAPQIHAGRVVVAHLGNGASMCGMLAGRSVGSTMGFSALDGLPMGTRTGQLDPGVILYLMEQESMSAAEISDLLYRRSGLLGLSGLSHDMRTLESAGTPEAERAIEYFVFRVRRELGAMAAVLSGLDAVVFCGGIGENSATVRARVCEGLQWLGVELDPGRNKAGGPVISTDPSRVRLLVIPTNEEMVIARASVAMLGA